MASLSPLLTATPTSPPTYNVGMAETFSWIPVEGAGRPLYARATYLANASDIAVSLSAGDININLEDVENGINTANSLLNGLTAVDYATEAKQESIITLLDALTAKNYSINLDVSAINVNTDEVEGLVRNSNTRLDVLTAVDYATSTKQDSVITLLDQLTANTDTIESLLQTSNSLLDSISAKQMTVSLDVSSINLNTDGIEGLIQTSNTLLDALTAKVTVTDIASLETKLDVLTAVDYATEQKQDTTITLLDSITAANINVPGFKIPPYDEIDLSYVGSTNNLQTVAYKNSSTAVMTLSFIYVSDPPSVDNALLKTVKKL